MYRQSEKNLLSSNISSTCSHNMANFGPLTAETGSGVCGTPANFNGFASCLRYCSDVAQWKPTKLCMMFGHLLGWYTIYEIHFRGLLPPDGILLGASAKLCGVVQGMELQNFCRRCNLYSSGRPSHWVSAHILVYIYITRYQYSVILQF